MMSRIGSVPKKQETARPAVRPNNQDDQKPGLVEKIKKHPVVAIIVFLAVGLVPVFNNLFDLWGNAKRTFGSEAE
jgi:hypothetical protein